MKVRPIHENLDTSFVNVSALVRYLQRRQFIGKIRVELSSYEADIFLDEASGLRVREHDRTAGRIAEGEDALQRILIRSREPGGIVSVYQKIPENEIALQKEEPKKIAEGEANEMVLTETDNLPKAQLIQNIKPASIKISAQDKEPQILTPEEKPQIENSQTPKPKVNLPNFPFKLSNQFEDKARSTNISPDDWQMLLNLLGELLETVNQTLAEANLDFMAAFEKARIEISTDYPFLNPSAEIFEYTNGKILMREKVSAKLFTASIIESLRRILERLSGNSKFSAIHRETTQKILALIRQRRQFYDKFSITKPLEKILGV